jgi:hypothetical protein
MDNFDNGEGAIRRYDLGHAWECNTCGNVLTRRCDAEACFERHKKENSNG